MPINNGIINQKGTPAFYSDIFANRPAFGYAGRVFISTDTGAIYEDTGSAWTLIADAGAGTTGTLQQVTTNGNTTTLGVTIQGININDGAGTGLNNIVIGGGLQSNTTGTQNTAIGIDSLVINTTGFNNTALGGTTLNNNTTGNYNTAIGYSSLQANTTGQYNTSIGESTLATQTTANNNTAVGSAALTANTTGTPNTAVGRLSLATNTTGGSNTAIGSQSLYLNTTGGSNTAIGVGALQNNTTASFNTAIGTQSLYANTTGQQNTAIGSSSLIANTTGATNTAIGYYTLSANTTGLNNIAIGGSALITNTTGSSNTAIGVGTLYYNTTGGNNTAIGNISLQQNTTGTLNTAIGVQSLSSNTTGTQNTAVGSTSGSSITTGSNNTILGNYTGTPTLANNIVLSDGAGNVRLFSDANGLIGINQAVGSTIGGQLDIHSTQTYALVLNGLSTSNAYTAFSNASVGKWRIGNTYNAGANSFDIFNLGTSSNAITISSTNNNIGIGTNLAQSLLDVELSASGGLGAVISVGNSAATTTLNETSIGFKASNAFISGFYSARISSIMTSSSVVDNAMLFYTYGSGSASGGTERARITSTGNVLINSTTDDTINKLQVNGKTISTAYKTFTGSVSAVTAVPTLIQSIGADGGQPSMYLIITSTSGGSFNDIAMAILVTISQGGGTARFALQSNGGSMLLTDPLNNGTVYVTQTTGSTQTVDYRILRIG